jgi:hypothetical protein
MNHERAFSGRQIVVLFWAGCLLLISAAGICDRVFGEALEPTPRARIEEIGGRVFVENAGKKSGGPLSIGGLLVDGDEVKLSGAAKLAWLDGGTISFPDPHGSGQIHIGLPAEPDQPVKRFAPIFVRSFTGAIDFAIPARQGSNRKFEIATSTVALSTDGARFTLAINDRTTATIVKVEEGKVDLVPANTQLKPDSLSAGQEVEVNKVSVIYNRESALRNGGGANSNAQSRAPGPYFIIVLKLYNFEEFYIGTEASLQDRPMSSFNGGGHPYPVQAAVEYQKLAGPFNSVAEARTAFCQNIAERKTFENGDLKGYWRPLGTWYALMDETVSFECPRQGAASESAAGAWMKPVLGFGVLIALAIGFVTYRMTFRR